MIRIITSLLVALTISPIKAQVETSDVPKLVVGITIDQLRGDYLEQFKHSLGERGFKRLLSGGMVYQNISFDFPNLNQASTLATIYTGANPNFHNIAYPQKYSLDNRHLQNVFADDNFIGNYTQDRLSPAALLGSTITDELKIASGGLSDVYSFAPNAVQALITGGHAANSAYWIDDYSGKWASTTYYKDFFWTVDQDNRKSNSFATKVWGGQWKPWVEKKEYNTFPYIKTQGAFQHSFGGDKDTYPLSKYTPFANENVSETFINLISKANLGKRDVPDFVSLTFYAGRFPKADDYGVEMKDLYIRLDKDIENLLDNIDKAIGLQNTLIYLTSTGYYESVIPDQDKTPSGGGVFHADRCEALLNMYLMALYGQNEKWVQKYHDGHIYLNRELIKAKELKLNDVQKVAAEFISDFSGVSAVYTRYQLLFENLPSQVEYIKNGITKNNIGDLVLEIQPGYKVVQEKDNIEKMTRINAISCPVIFFGHNIKAEKIRRTIKATEIAPSVAYIMRIRAPSAAKETPLAEFLQ